MLFSNQYIRWNNHLIDFCIEQAQEDEEGRFCLCVRQMLDDCDDPIASEADFISCVRGVYKSATEEPGDILRRLGSAKAPNGRPLSMALLGLAVLAAEEMEDLGYYKHLSELLNQPLAGYSIYRFNRESFEFCWNQVNGWLRTQGLAMELPDARESRFIRWPKMHALLRQVDMEKLPRFFHEKGLSPLQWYGERTIAERFSAWIHAGHSGLTHAGIKAWSDPTRRPGILLQVRRALNQWDGNQSQSLRRSDTLRRTRAWLHLDYRNQSPRMSARALHPAGFPDALPSGFGGEWRAEGDYYEEIPLPQAAYNKLQVGLETPSGRWRVALRGSRLFVFSQTDFGLESMDGQLRLGELGAILCRAALATQVSDFLTEICDESPSRYDLGGHWVLFGPVRPRRAVDPPAGLDTLSISTRAKMRICGGLKSGRASWLDCAPPSYIQITGNPAPSEVSLNGCLLDVIDGRADIADTAILQTVNEVQAGHLSERFIIEPSGVRNLSRINTPEPVIETGDSLAESADTTSWILLGPSPGDIARSNELNKPTRTAKWAIGHLGGARCAMVSIGGPQSSSACSSNISHSRRDIYQWTEAILSVRRPRFGATSPSTEVGAVVSAWLAYRQTAQRIRSVRLRHQRQAREKRFE